MPIETLVYFLVARSQALRVGRIRLVVDFFTVGDLYGGGGIRKETAAHSGQ